MLTLPFDESVVMPESQMCRKFSRECEDQKQIKKPESFSKQIVLRGKSIKRAPGEGNGQLTPVFLPEKSLGQSLVGYSPWGHKESDTIW